MKKPTLLQILIGMSLMLPLAGFVANSTSEKHSPQTVRDLSTAGPPRPVSTDRTLSAVSLNLAKETDPEKIVDAIRSTPRLRDAGLFLFQEVAKKGENPSVAETAARTLGYFASFAPAPGDDDQGLALVSRYPIRDVRLKRLKAYDLRFRSRSRFALSATVRTPWKDLRVWNVHLDTRINAEERLAQLRPVLEDAAARTGPRLIGGDFNTNDLYWVGNVLPLPGGPSHTDAIRDTMLAHGFETPLPAGLDTFPPFRRHLDWIFVNEAGVSAASVAPAPFSDHNAVWARIHL